MADAGRSSDGGSIPPASTLTLMLSTWLYSYFYDAIAIRPNKIDSLMGFVGEEIENSPSCPKRKGIF